MLEHANGQKAQVLLTRAKKTKGKILPSIEKGQKTTSETLMTHLRRRSGQRNSNVVLNGTRNTLLESTYTESSRQIGYCCIGQVLERWN